jgi:hypothetical protein
VFSPFICVTIRDVYAKLTVGVWWGTILLEFVILARLLKTALVREYPFFFAYLSCVFLSSASGYVVYAYRSQETYKYWYWTWEFVCVIAGYSLILEIIDKGLGDHPGIEKHVRNLALLGFAAIVGFISLQSLRSRSAVTLRTSVEVERDLRAAEAVLLVLIMAAIAYYGIKIGKGLRGIVLGYGLCVATIVVGDAVRSYSGPSFQGFFSSVRSWSYLLSLLIWTAALWSYQPSTISERPIPPRNNSEILASQTRKEVESMRGELEKAIRQ